MRKWLIFILVILVLMGAVAIGLASQADNHIPEPGEVRLEIENVL